MKPHQAQTLARLILDYNDEKPTEKALTKLTYQVFMNPELYINFAKERNLLK
jgi:hypothetical protein